MIKVTFLDGNTTEFINSDNASQIDEGFFKVYEKTSGECIAVINKDAVKMIEFKK